MMDERLSDLLEGVFPSPPIRSSAYPRADYSYKMNIDIAEKKQHITILHVADIRYGWKGPNSLHESKHKKVWQALINTFRDKVLMDIDDPNLVTICGDIAYSGAKEEYELCQSEFILPLLKTLNLSQENLLTCPGNHDSDKSLDKGDGYIPEKGVPIKGDKRRHLTRERYVSLSDKFHNYSDSFFNSTGLNTLVYNRGWKDLLFLSLNSAWYSSYHETSDGSLLLGKESCKEQVDLLYNAYHKDFKKTVVLLHHPLHTDRKGFCWFHMEEQEPNMTTSTESFIQYVEDSAYIILTGSPILEQNIIPEPHGKCIVSCGITRDNKKSKGNYTYSAALIEIHDIIVTVKLLKYDLFEGGEYWTLKADNYKFYQDSPIQMQNQAKYLEAYIEETINNTGVTIASLISLWNLVRGNRAVRESTKNKLFERIYQVWKQTSPDEDLDIGNTNERDSRIKH